MDDAWLEYIICKADENQSIIREADKDQRVGALLSVLDEADIVVAIWRDQNQPRGVGYRVVTGQLLMEKSIEREEPIPAELTGIWCVGEEQAADLEQTYLDLRTARLSSPLARRETG